MVTLGPQGIDIHWQAFQKLSLGYESISRTNWSHVACLADFIAFLRAILAALAYAALCSEFLLLYRLLKLACST